MLNPRERGRGQFRSIEPEVVDYIDRTLDAVEALWPRLTLMRGVGEVTAESLRRRAARLLDQIANRRNDPISTDFDVAV
jgi:hypothetical protein